MTVESRGIVICAGGVRYSPCAYVLIRLLRHLGCQLPIEVWYRGEEEGDRGWRGLVEPLGVRCVDAFEVRERCPHPRLGGWELKPYAILHSGFDEVLLLDADNVPVFDPTYLFADPDYLRHGAMFWPDPAHIRTPPESERWRVFGVPYRDEPEFETGQAVIDKRRCRAALELTNWYNERSDYYYRVVYGDKDTFRFAWHKCEQRFAMTGHPVVELPHTLCQHDMQGRRLFQHRFAAKFSLFANPRIPGFVHEDLCLGFLADLRRQWSPAAHLCAPRTDADRARTAELMGREFLHVVQGFGHWPLELGPHGYVGRGGGQRRAFWWVENNELVLAEADGRVASRLAADAGGGFAGTGPGNPRIAYRLLPREKSAEVAA